VRADEFPVVAEYLRDCVGRGTAAIHVVLYEDTYESGQGDGEFHYPEAVFFDLESAKKYKGDDSGCYRYHIRPGVIWLDRETIGCEVPRRISLRVREAPTQALRGLRQLTLYLPEGALPGLRPAALRLQEEG